MPDGADPDRVPDAPAQAGGLATDWLRSRAAARPESSVGRVANGPAVPHFD
ncbi:MAG TPA: hypothetical protein VGS19_02175 [Streptosporangiaceae bacterium]|nr:hypothetical protein [Streptosporangiaceae bacterium]